MLGLQEGDVVGNGSGEPALVHQIADGAGGLGELHQTVELHGTHAHFFGNQLVRLRAALGATDLPACLALHTVRFHTQGAGEIVGGNVLTVQVSVRDKDTGVVIVELLDDRGDGIVQFGGNQVAALAGQDFQLAVLVEAGKNGVFHAEALDGLVQLLEIVAVPVNGEGVNICLFQIGRVEDRGERFALAGDRQRLLVLFRGWAELFT